MALKAGADNNRVAIAVADTGRLVFFHDPRLSGASLVRFTQRYFSFELYRLGNRLQLDSRVSALLGAQVDYMKKGCSDCVSANPVALCRQCEPGPPIARRMKI